MYNLVRKNIIEKKLIDQGDNILIGLSGGPDSIFLFHNLRLLKEILSFNLYASHINHMYRGEDAHHDEEFVRNLCNKYGIKLFVKRKNAADYAKELKVTEEEAGRILRYNFFRENLNKIGGNGKIAVAHNLNDQAETVLQRLIRGTGIDGLCAMTFINDDIIRPILNVKRIEIEKYLQENNYEFCIDKTNSQDVYGRNKIRLNLIPYLEKYFNPNIQSTLFRMSETMERDKKIIDGYINNRFEDAFLYKNKYEIALDLNIVNSMKDFEIGRIIRLAIEKLKGSTNNIEMKHIDYAIDFISSGKTGKKIDLSDGYLVEISYNNLIVKKVIDKIPSFTYNVIINSPLYIKETGKTVTCKVLDISLYDQKDKNSVSLDYDLIEGNLVIRNRRVGDSIVPCGMTGSKKIKDIFIDMKIPIDERNIKLVVADEKNILWLEGFRIHNSYKVTTSTKKILNISIREEQYE